jgi:hypothetical protein
MSNVSEDLKYCPNCGIEKIARFCSGCGFDFQGDFLAVDDSRDQLVESDNIADAEETKEELAETEPDFDAKPEPEPEPEIEPETAPDVEAEPESEAESEQLDSNTAHVEDLDLNEAPLEVIEQNDIAIESVAEVVQDQVVVEQQPAPSVAEALEQNVPLAEPVPEPIVLPESGWYQDPISLSQFRYWNGFNWTERVAASANAGEETAKDKKQKHSSSQEQSISEQKRSSIILEGLKRGPNFNQSNSCYNCGYKFSSSTTRCDLCAAEQGT